VRVESKLLATFRKYLPPDTKSSSYDMEVRPGTLLEDLLPELPLPQEMEKVVLVNGRGPQPGQVLQEDDVVCLFPVIAGG